MTKRSWIRRLLTRPVDCTIRKATSPSRPGLEVLEDRYVPSTIVVTNPTDTPVLGQTSLREAITQANSAGGDEAITFDPLVFSTPQTISLTGGQLELSDTTGTETITGPAGGVTVNGNNASRVFQVDSLVTASVSGLTITGGNAGFDYGGGVFNRGTATLTNCTISGNSAGPGGGVSSGSYFYQGASTSLINCTVSGNSGFDGLFSYFGTTTLTNTIVAGQTGGDIAGTVSGSNNLIGTGGSGGLIDKVDGNIVGVANPGLAPLGNYGGTSQTVALLPGSPAIDGGSSGADIPTTDQRGLDRVGAVDIGAFESQGFVVTLAPGSTPQSANIGTAFAHPLGLSVTANNPVEPVDGAVIRFEAHPAANGATAMFLDNSAVIANGQVAVTAVPNNVLGTYTVVPAIGGSSASFSLTNTGTPFAALVVNTTSDALAPVQGLSLREAIAFTNADPSGLSAITFDKHVFAKPQTITLTGSQLELSNTNETVTITAPKAGVTVSGGGLSRVFQIDGLVTASISGVTITGGSSGPYGTGGGLLNYGTTTLTNCTVSGNSAFGGGGVANSYYSTLTLTKCTISGNSATRSGGGLVNSGTLTMTNSRVSGNSSYNGCGMYNGYGATATLNNCVISGNSTTAADTNGGSLASGGGVFNVGQLTLFRSTVSGNSAIFGGGLYDLFGTASLTNSSVSDNTASSGGGGIFNFFGSATLTNCTVSGNSTRHAGAYGGGGGVYNGANSMLTLTNCTISGNVDNGNNGGGVFNNNRGTARLTNCTVDCNSTTGSGGGVFNGTLSTATLTNCTVSGNAASVGGGIANQGANSLLTITSSKIIKNHATSKGGGISTTGGSATITDTTVKGNEVKSSGTALGGGIDCENCTLSLTNSKVKDNEAKGSTAQGGGIYLALNSTVSLTNTDVNDNEAKGTVLAQGGGIASVNSTLSLNNCTVKDNEAEGATAQGGGIYALNSVIDIRNSTLTGNEANGCTLGQGGGIYSNNSLLTLSGAKVKHNHATTSGDDVFIFPGP